MIGFVGFGGALAEREAMLAMTGGSGYDSRHATFPGWWEFLGGEK